MINPKLTLKATVLSRGAASSYLKKPGDAVIVDRQGPRWLILMCPCGCGEEFPINLDSRSGPAWRLYKNQRTGLSLYPSVWRESECKSHYIIWRNKIFLFNRYDEDFYDTSHKGESLRFKNAVREQLSTQGFISFYDIAEVLGEIPWDVLMACRSLVQEGFAYERSGKQRGSFRRR
ncbi:MAG: DUF6527 family protein [Gallionellaceae bacterium]